MYVMSCGTYICGSDLGDTLTETFSYTMLETNWRNKWELEDIILDFDAKTRGSDQKFVVSLTVHTFKQDILYYKFILYK